MGKPPFAPKLSAKEENLTKKTLGDIFNFAMESQHETAFCFKISTILWFGRGNGSNKTQIRKPPTEYAKIN